MIECKDNLKQFGQVRIVLATEAPPAFLQRVGSCTGACIFFRLSNKTTYIINFYRREWFFVVEYINRSLDYAK